PETRPEASCNPNRVHTPVTTVTDTDQPQHQPEPHHHNHAQPTTNTDRTQRANHAKSHADHASAIEDNAHPRAARIRSSCLSITPPTDSSSAAGTDNDTAHALHCPTASTTSLRMVRDSESVR